VADRYRKPYLDACVWIAAVVGEPTETHEHAETSAHILRLAEAGIITVVSSTILPVELLGRRGHPRVDSGCDSLLEGLTKSSTIEWVELDHLTALRARELGRRYNLQAVDSVHLASALRGGADQFLTWDKDFSEIFGETIEGCTVERAHVVGQQLGLAASIGELTGDAEDRAAPH
jgi:predicted nucleic acid-binding protein